MFQRRAPWCMLPTRWHRAMSRIIWMKNSTWTWKQKIQTEWNKQRKATGILNAGMNIYEADRKVPHDTSVRSALTSAEYDRWDQWCSRNVVTTEEWGYKNKQEEEGVYQISRISGSTKGHARSRAETLWQGEMKITKEQVMTMGIQSEGEDEK